MGNGNINVGNKTPTRKSGHAVERLVRDNGASELRIDPSNQVAKQPPGNCGAMSLQSGDSGRGTESAPQKFVQLVGCREPNARPQPGFRPRPAKR